MGSKEEVFDSPQGWVRDHIRGYVESDGRNGHLWRGVHTLLLTTRGRKTGKLHRTALIYGQDGKNFIVVASNGGAPEHPNWYQKLVITPQVEIQVCADIYTANARTATKEEKPRLWKMMAEIFPDYQDYQAKTTREIPVVIVEPD
jgi:deazaflavin-dependent oxidoreductase (nitroreductase family)